MEQSNPPTAVGSNAGLGPLAPERDGQPRMMTLAGGEVAMSGGHWYSPAAVRERIDAERARVLAAVEQRIRSWRQRTMNKSGDCLALDDFMGQESIDDLVDCVCDEWANVRANLDPTAAPKHE